MFLESQSPTRMEIRNLDVSMSQARPRVVNCRLSEDDSFSGNFLHLTFFKPARRNV